MVKTAVKEDFSQHTIEKFSQGLKKILDEPTREKLKAKVVAGRITDPEEVRKQAERMLEAKQEKGKPREDLMVHIAIWTDNIQIWRKALKEVIPHRKYFDTNPKIAAEFRAEVRGLMADLEKLL